jgi:hypothetical protein
MRPSFRELAAILSLIACPLAAAELAVSAPYVRLLPPGAPTSAAYLVIENSGAADRRLVKAESPAAQSVELHEHRNENGVMKMREVGGIPIKAHGRTVLEPGGYHLMLLGLKEALKEGDSVPITLVFDDGSRQALVAPVRKMQTGMDHGAMKH